MKISEISNTWTLTENLKLKIGFDVHGVTDTYPPLKEWQASNVVCAVGIPEKDVR